MSTGLKIRVTDPEVTSDEEFILAFRRHHRRYALRLESWFQERRGPKALAARAGTLRP